MKKKTRIILIISIIVLILGGFLINKYLLNSSLKGKTEEKDAKSKDTKGGRGDRAVPVGVYIAGYVKLDEGIRSVGTLLPYEEVDIASEITGKIETIAFEEGAFVKKGSLLIKVNDEDLQAQLRRAVYQRNMTKDKLERNRILLEKDAISRESFDQIETDYNVIQADIQLLEVRIAKTEIRAPFDGVIGFRYVSVGSYLQPSTLIARIVDYSKLRVAFAIPEKYSNLAVNDAMVSFTVEGNATVNQARIYAIDPKVDENTRTLSIRALYENSGMRLRSGMFAAVTIGEKQGVTLQIPTQAIIPDADNKKVFLVKNGTAVPVTVLTGVRSEDMIEITQGLSKADTIIISGLMQVRDGAKVIITNIR